MIVKKLESPVYYSRKKRQPLPGRVEEKRAANLDKSFDQYLLEAFQGEVVQAGRKISRKVSEQTRENLVRLS